MIKLRVAFARDGIEPNGRCTTMSNALEKNCKNNPLIPEAIKALGGSIIVGDGTAIQPHTWCETESDTILDIAGDQFTRCQSAGMQELKLPAIRVLHRDSEDAKEYLLGLSKLV
jgi:hypothetical protein